MSRHVSAIVGPSGRNSPGSSSVQSALGAEKSGDPPAVLASVARISTIPAKFIPLHREIHRESSLWNGDQSVGRGRGSGETSSDCGGYLSGLLRPNGVAETGGSEWARRQLVRVKAAV